MNEKSAYYIEKIRELEDEIIEIREVHDVWHIKYDTLLTDYEQKWGLSMRRQYELKDEVTPFENERFDLKADRNAATIMEQQAEITALKKRVRELEAQAYVTSENYTATSTELRIAELRNKELEAENEEQKCSDCGIVKEYYSRIKELEAAGAGSVTTMCGSR